MCKVGVIIIHTLTVFSSVISGTITTVAIKDSIEYFITDKINSLSVS